MLDHAQALAVGQAHIGQAQVECLGVQKAYGFRHRLRARRVEPHARQRELEQFQQIGLVVDDEHFGLSALAWSPAHDRSPRYPAVLEALALTLTSPPG